jgi:archaellum component FlaC
MDTATRKDIDEVIDIVRDFMQQVDLRFTHIENEIVELKKSHNHLINTVDGLLIVTKPNLPPATVSLNDY